ncbi:IAA-alanine resistance protein 1 [Camellia lanceoleosa]|uniref:IAA-alanine resistance protein 1 n=1 Tax=Camellia lanceoleosa TaxID=1840588 RepID=A0ACC0G0M1_9ERIC|nr:IAA-alanine resistance protein 1 [Camellia lanceoleosa]
MVEEIHMLETRQGQKALQREEQQNTDGPNDHLPTASSLASENPSTSTKRTQDLSSKCTRNEFLDIYMGTEELVNLSYENLSRHQQICVGANTTSGSGGVSLKLGLHQNNGIGLSEPFPINAARRFGLEANTEGYVMGSFEAQNRQFGRDMIGGNYAKRCFSSSIATCFCKKLKDDNDDDDKIQQQSLNEKNESVSEMSSQGKVSDKGSEKQNQPESLRKKKTGSGAGKDNISDAPNGSTHYVKSVVEKELSHSPSNLVFGYLNLFSDGVHNFIDGMALGSAFLLYGSVGFMAGGFVYIAVAKVLAEMNNGSSLAIKSTVL